MSCSAGRWLSRSRSLLWSLLCKWIKFVCWSWTNQSPNLRPVWRSRRSCVTLYSNPAKTNSFRDKEKLGSIIRPFTNKIKVFVRFHLFLWIICHQSLVYFCTYHHRLNFCRPSNEDSGCSLAQIISPGPKVHIVGYLQFSLHEIDKACGHSSLYVRTANFDSYLVEAWTRLRTFSCVQPPLGAAVTLCGEVPPACGRGSCNVPPCCFAVLVASAGSIMLKIFHYDRPHRVAHRLSTIRGADYIFVMPSVAMPFANAEKPSYQSSACSVSLRLNNAMCNYLTLHYKGSWMFRTNSPHGPRC